MLAGQRSSQARCAGSRPAKLAQSRAARGDQTASASASIRGSAMRSTSSVVAIHSVQTLHVIG